jgi:hypothetical protein
MTPVQSQAIMDCWSRVYAGAISAGRSDGMAEAIADIAVAKMKRTFQISG